MSSDIRKWFMKQHGKSNTDGSAVNPSGSTPEKSPLLPTSQKRLAGEEGNSSRRKTSKYFANTSVSNTSSKKDLNNEVNVEKPPTKRKAQNTIEELDVEVKPSSVKKFHNDPDDFVHCNRRKKLDKTTTPKKLKSVDVKKVEEDDNDDEYIDASVKSAGKGGGGRGSATNHGGRGGGRGGRGSFMHYGERKDPPHKGEKDVPEGAPNCLSGLTFVISGTLDSLEREEAEDLIKRHGGRVTTSVSKKTSFLLADEDIGGNKSKKAKELGTSFLTEDGLFDMIHKSKPEKGSVQDSSKMKTGLKGNELHPKCSTESFDLKGSDTSSLGAKVTSMAVLPSKSPNKQKSKTSFGSSLIWAEKYRPKVPNDIVGNQSLVKQLHDWLANWHQQHLHTEQKGKGKKQTDNGSKKAVLLSGSPGIGKSTAAKLVSQMLGYQAIEVNASDNRGKADTKIFKGIGGNTSNSIKEVVRNEALSYGKDWSNPPKLILIMDEVDGMSAGDRGGVADLISSIKISKIPIICICNDRYNQKLKSLVNYCMPLNFRRPTKQQMAKRLMQIAVSEGLQVNEITLEELSDRVNGDMRMALNQLQYMSYSQSALDYDDIRKRLQSSAKDEDISPFTAVDKLFSFNAGKLRMDERIDLCMSDPDLVPLIIQENYINFKPSSISKDENGIKRLNYLAKAAESITDGDIVNVQIRRYRQWQLSQAGSFASCIIPAALMHGSREAFEPGERNYNRFGGWLGKNSTAGKNLRLLEDIHVHVLASQASNLDRETLRVDYFSLLLQKLTNPLRMLSKEDAVLKVVELMDAYSISQEDYETVMELSKFQGHSNPLDGIQPSVKAALTRAYKQGSSHRVVKVADLIPLPGIKKAPKKRIAAILEPVDNVLPEEGGTTLENEEMSDAEDPDAVQEDDGGPKLPQLDLRSDKSKGIQVQLDLATNGKQAGKKIPTRKNPSSVSAEKASTSARGKRKR